MNFEIIDLRDRMAENQARWQAEQDYIDDLLAGQMPDPIAEHVVATGTLPGAAGPEHGDDYHLKAR